MIDDKLLKALGEPKRFFLLQLMAERAYCVKALANRSGLSESAVSQHLKILREAGLVCGVKKGYYTHYSVEKEMLRCVITGLEQIVSCEKKSCGGAFYGCREAEAVGCPMYVPPEQRTGDD